ncbi:oxidoreductase [Sediminispirochaeta smaragdinae]|uniref:oxidoreductase n=1 Tax=Sediminispirochaeta smaragdinae TaxID=55206 RepID=UPI0002DFC65E|nr:hypothetical protein [Sediminispirochaeta smaragdinae]
MNDVIPHELTVDEIKQIVEMFGDYAFFYKRGGYDGVEISGAHGYLIAEFMSTYANKRSDEYGRTLECTTSPMSYPPAYLADYAKEIKSVVNKSERICLMDELKIKSLTDAKVVEIQEDGIIVNKDGENIKLVCDTVVLAFGTLRKHPFMKNLRTSYLLSFCTVIISSFQQIEFSYHWDLKQ